jgi:hypothetical protein
MGKIRAKLIIAMLGSVYHNAFSKLELTSIDERP